MITSGLGRDIGFGQPGAFRSLPPAFMGVCRTAGFCIIGTDGPSPIEQRDGLLN
jgi:hypothetical protein